MIKVLLLAEELHTGGFIIDPITLPEAPLLGDKFRVCDFKYEGTQKLEDYFKQNNLSDLAQVYDRIWGVYEGEIVLFVFLNFGALENEGENPDYFFF